MCVSKTICSRNSRTPQSALDHENSLSFPKPSADFGLLSQDYHFEYNALRIFLHIIVDTVLWMLRVLSSVVLPIRHNSENNILLILHFLHHGWYPPVCCGVPINGDHSPHSHSSDTVWTWGRTCHQTSVDIQSSHMTESESGSEPLRVQGMR